MFVLASQHRHIDGASAALWPPGDCQRSTARANGTANDQQYAALIAISTSGFYQLTTRNASQADLLAR